MAERVQLATRTSESKKENSASTIRKTESPQSMSSAADRVLYLQRTIGNQAVQRLIKSGTLQAKLKIGQPGDKYEQEADRVVDALMQMPEPGVQRQEEPEEEEETLLAKSLAEEITPLVQRQVEPEEEDEELQAKATSGRFSEVNSNLESQIQSLKGGGQPLSENNRAFFEPRFGYDFSEVRVHTGSHAAKTARSINARAFTVGQNIAFGAGQYAPESGEGQRLLAHELTHVAQQGAGDIINRQPTPPESENITKLRQLLKDDEEKQAIAVMGKLTENEKRMVLASREFKELAISSFNNDEMYRGVKAMRGDLYKSLEWMFDEGTDWGKMRDIITRAPSGKDRVRTDNRMKDQFVGICNDKQMVEAVDLLGGKLLWKLSWMYAEGVGSWKLIKDKITATGVTPDEKKDVRNNPDMKRYFIKELNDKQMVEAVDLLGGKLLWKLSWMVAEGTNADLVRGVIAAAPIAEVLTVRTDPVLSALLAKEVGDTDVLAERLAQEVLSYIKSQAATRAAAPPSIDPTSRFYKALKDKYLKDYLAAPSPLEGTKAVERIGKPMQTRRSPTDPNIIEVQPEGGAWRPAENRWEKGAELFWNKQKVPDLPSELRHLPIFQNIKTLPSELAAGTGMLIRENLTDLPYLDVPFLLGVPNTSTATLTVDVIKGGKNLSQLMHWATGVKYSSKSPKALRELFLAYEKWHLEGWDVFGQDALNDLIAEEQGRLLGTELQKGSAGAIKSEADLLPFLNRSFLQSRAWVGAMLRHRRSELDAWILSKEQKLAKMHWGALPEAKLWPSRTVYKMFAEGESIGAVKSSSLVVSQIEIYTLLFEAAHWESAHGPIDLTDLEKALIAGNLDAILAWKAKGGGLSGAGAASEERRKLKGGP